jgi:hypothetical protein
MTNIYNYYRQLQTHKSVLFRIVVVYILADFISSVINLIKKKLSIISNVYYLVYSKIRFS